MRAPMQALERLATAGFELAVVDGCRLCVSPASRLTAEQRRWIRANRDALVAVLRARDDANVLELVSAFGTSVASVVPEHEQAPPPPVSSCLPDAGLVRCADCRHAIAAQYDEPGAWRLCRVGGRSGWSMQERHCQKWEVHQ